MVTGHIGFPSRNAQMAMSGMRTASTAGVSMSGVLAIFGNWEEDCCFPGTPYLPELRQELDGLFHRPAW